MKEDIYYKAASNLNDEKVLIVCDRGLLDNKAYMTKRDFDYLLKSKRLNEIKLRDSYDAVFHLVTSANGAEEYFLIDDPLRDGLIEEAKRGSDIVLNIDMMLVLFRNQYHFLLIMVIVYLRMLQLLLIHHLLYAFSTYLLQLY